MIPMLLMVYGTPCPASAISFAAGISFSAFGILLKSIVSKSPSSVPFAVIAWESSITSMVEFGSAANFV